MKNKITYYIISTLFIVMTFNQQLLSQSFIWHSGSYCISNMNKNIHTLEKELKKDNFLYQTSKQICNNIIANAYKRIFWKNKVQIVMTFKGLKAYGMILQDKEAFEIQRGKLIYYGFRKFPEYSFDNVSKKIRDCITNNNKSSKPNKIEALIYKGNLAIVETYKEKNGYSYFLIFLHPSHYNFN